MWTARPALDRRKRPHVGQGIVSAKSADEDALALRAARLLYAAVMHLLSADRAPVFTTVRQAGRSEATASQLSMLILSSLRVYFRVSLHRFWTW